MEENKNMEENKKDRVLLFLNNCTTLTPIVEIDDPDTDLAEAKRM